MTQHCRTKIKKTFVATVLVANLFCLPQFTWADAPLQIKTEIEKMNLSTGVQYSAYQVIDEQNSKRINVVSIDPNDPYTRMEVALTNGDLSSREKPSEMGRRMNAEGKGIVAAANGDFFSTAAPYYPIGMQITNHELIISPQGFPTLGLTKDKKYMIGTPVLNASAGSVNRGSNFSYPLAHVNRQRGTDMLVLYTPAMGANTATNDYGTEIILKPDDRVLKAGSTYECLVTAVTTDRGNNPIPADSWVLSGNGKAQDFLQRFLLGDTIQLSLTFADDRWNDVVQAVGGHDLLLENGRPTAVLGNNDSLTVKCHARTVAGLTPDGDLELVVVEAKAEEGDGMTLPEITGFLQSRGIVTAINLDGGGSSVLAGRNPGDNFLTLLTTPSDGGRERAVANGLLFFSTAPRGALKYLQLNPQTVKLFQGSHVQFSLKAQDEYYNPRVPDSVDWEAEEKVGSFAPDGLFQATGEGTGLITATAENASAYARVTVVNQIADLKISPAGVQLEPGATQQFTVTAYDENGEVILVDQDLYQWTVDPQLGTMDSATGVLTVTGPQTGGEIKVELGGKEAAALINSGLQAALAGNAVAGQQVTISVTHNNQPVAGALIRQVQPVESVGVINASALYIRTKPDTKSSAIDKLPRDTQLTVLSKDGDWCRVRLADGKEGYAFAEYLIIQGAGVLGQTDENGQFVFKVNVPGEYVFQAEKDNYLPATLTQTFVKK